LHLHLAEVAVCQIAELQVDQDETAQQTIVEHEVDVEVVAVEGEALLSREEAEPLAEFEHEFLQVVDDGLLEVALAPVGLFGQTEEFEDDGVLHDILWGEDLLAAAREGEDLVLVAAGGEALVEVGGDLAFEFTAGPALAGGFDLVEGAG
jgi:hypothetical protein